MFYCLRHAPHITAEVARAQLAALSDADFETALGDFLTDYLMVADHLCRDDAYLRTSSLETLRVALRAHSVPDLHTLNRVVGFVLFELSVWRPRFRPLTDAEQQILAAAWRLSDCIHGPRDTQ